MLQNILITPINDIIIEAMINAAIRQILIDNIVYLIYNYNLVGVVQVSEMCCYGE